jgi:hypothetical protein
MMPKITTVILNNILMNQIRQLNSPKKRLVCTKQVRKPDINPYRYVIQQENIVIDNQWNALKLESQDTFCLHACIFKIIVNAKRSYSLCNVVNIAETWHDALITLCQDGCIRIITQTKSFHLCSKKRKVVYN